MIFEAVEYGLHRVLHHPSVARWVPYHKRHHRRYHDSHEYNGTTIKALLQQVGVTGLFLAAWINEWGAIALYVTWAIMVYNAMHCVSHTNVWPTVRAYHRAHHRNPFKNIGVSSPLIDWGCGTMHPEFVVRTPFLLLLPPPISFLGVRHKPSESTKSTFVPIPHL